MVAVDLARPGASVADARYGLQAQAREVPAAVDYVLIGGGSADVCGEDIVSVKSLISPERFERAVRDALDVLSARRPRVNVFVSSIPDWAQLYANDTLRTLPRPTYACPLLFGPDADANTAAAAADAIRSYNAALARACAAPELGGLCRSDGGAAAAVRFGVGDLSTVDYFHPSKRGQAKLAAATWPATAFAQQQPAQPQPQAQAPSRPERRTETARACPPTATGPARRARRRRLACRARRADRETRRRSSGAAQRPPAAAPARQLDRSNRQRHGPKTIFGNTFGRVIIRLRIPEHILRRSHTYAIQIYATANGQTPRTAVPFTP